ncbi:hypothetical protein HYFRA_00011656 [Hymenoscyphus fraxineus]|uniref:Uncharacterized protein n=1 Tax=Hymenoscyphus fraxineus TaxID=746836 RepID=A0A9N9L1D1_9HELO|nr:hypothetical protein HYFRA_00011656 [Hymenoscyphus fraxineus]
MELDTAIGRISSPLAPPEGDESEMEQDATNTRNVKRADVLPAVEGATQIEISLAPVPPPNIERQEILLAEEEATQVDISKNTVPPPQTEQADTNTDAADNADQQETRRRGLFGRKRRGRCTVI